MKRITLLFLVFLAAQTASAQDWARASLEKSSRHREWVTVKHDSRSVETFVVYPESKDKRPVVLVIHEIFGMTDWVQDLADQVAEAGYVAVAPDLLSGMAPNGGRSSDFPQGQATEAVSKLNPDQVTADLNVVFRQHVIQAGMSKEYASWRIALEPGGRGSSPLSKEGATMFAARTQCGAAERNRPADIIGLQPRPTHPTASDRKSSPRRDWWSHRSAVRLLGGPQPDLFPTGTSGRRPHPRRKGPGLHCDNVDIDHPGIWAGTGIPRHPR